MVNVLLELIPSFAEFNLLSLNINFMEFHRYLLILTNFLEKCVKTIMKVIMIQRNQSFVSFETHFGETWKIYGALRHSVFFNGKFYIFIF